MKTDQFRINTYMGQDLTRDASVFCRNDDWHFAQYADGAQRQIFEVADGRGDNVERRHDKWKLVCVTRITHITISLIWLSI